MAQSSSPISAVAERYAGSLFDLAAGSGAIAEVEANLASFEALVAGSADLERMILSPVFSADEQRRAIVNVAERAGIKGLVASFLGVVAANRRLFAVPSMIRAFRRIAAEHRGETAAEVTAAHPLTPAQQAELEAALKGVAGRDVAISVTVDPALLGGLVVRLGSRQIDTSLRTKLNSLKLALKEVG